MAELTIEQDVVRGNGIVLLLLTGYIDAHTFEMLEETIVQVFSNEQYQIIFDLRNLDYISSAGVGVIIAAAHQARLNHGQVVLLCPSQDVREVLEMLGVAEFAAISNGFVEALALFQ
jgi:anti-sigma B factor antagonist